MNGFRHFARDVEIGPARGDEIDAIVALHRDALPYTMNSRLGGSHLRHLYRAMMRQKDSMVDVARCGGHVAGVVSATLTPRALKKALLDELPLSGKVRICLLFAIHPEWWLDYFHSSRTEEPVIWRGMPVEAVLTTVAVDRQLRRSGVGKALIERVDAFVASNGRRAYRLDTRSSAASAFYQAIGFLHAEQRGPDTILIKLLSE